MSGTSTTSPDEAEEVFFERPLIGRSRDGRYLAPGRIEAGRYLMVVFARRHGGVLRVITARDMSTAQRDDYGRHRQ